MATFDMKDLLTWCSNNNCKLTLEFNPETVDGPFGDPYLTITVSKWSNAEHNWCHKKQIVPCHLLGRLEVDEFKEYIEYMRYEVRDAVIEKDRGWRESMEYKRKTLIEPDPPLHKYSKEKVVRTMPKYYKREDIERFFNGFPFGKEEIHFSIMDILSNLDSIPTVNALELNEDLELMLKQLGYEKVKE